MSRRSAGRCPLPPGYRACRSRTSPPTPSPGRQSAGCPGRRWTRTACRAELSNRSGPATGSDDVSVPVVLT
ncbi:hypothetical protein AZA_37802 [Nitrospirillum viridazoti Y2]|nr:hypothetical protein AZA_37802 [Nitrospirillum amazonense Y2]